MPPRRSRKKKKPVVALLFGSFNPIHEGHLAILQYLVDHTPAAEVRLVVSPQSPFKAGQGLVDNALERLEGARQAVAEAGLPVVVSDVEFHLPEPWYTIDTLRFLQAQEPEKEFVLVMEATISLPWIAGAKAMRSCATLPSGFIRAPAPMRPRSAPSSMRALASKE